MKQHLVLAAFLAMLILPAHALAADFDGIGISPGPAITGRDVSGFHYDAKPGQIFDDTLKVVNTSSRSRTLSLAITSGQVSADNHFICAQAADPAAWLTLASSTVTLGPSQRMSVRLKLVVPPVASAGEHQACIVAQEIATQLATSQAVHIQSRVAMRASVTIPGTISNGLALQNLATRYSSRQVTATARLINHSSIGLATTSQVTLQTILGHDIARASLQSILLPKAYHEAKYKALVKPFWGGWYKLQVSANATPTSKQVTLMAGQNHKEAAAIIFIRPAAQVVIYLGAAMITIILCLVIFRRMRA